MKNIILDRLKEKREMRLKGCLYHYTQIKFAYNTNRLEIIKQERILSAIQNCG